MLLEQFRIRYLPVESVSMQERVRILEFVVGHTADIAELPARVAKRQV